MRKFDKQLFAIALLSPILIAACVQAETAQSPHSDTSQSFWPGWAVAATLTAAIVAAIASILNALYSSHQQKQLAQIQGSIQSSVQKELQTFQHELERSRQRDTYLNERVTLHLAQLQDVAAEIHGLAGLVGFRYWLSRGDWLETEGLFRAANAKLQLHMRALITLGVVSEGFIQRWNIEIRASVLVEWMEVIGLVALLDPEHRKKFPNDPPFSEKLYFERWQTLQTKTSTLTNYVADLTADIVKARTK